MQRFFPLPFTSCDNCLPFILVSGAAVVEAELFTTMQSSDSMLVGDVVVNNNLAVSLYNIPSEDIAVV